MELEIGMYVRTLNGKIWIIKSQQSISGHKKDIINASYNIIDLIEVGDLLKIEYYSLRYNERVTRLFEVTYKDERYINLSNAKCEFMLIENDFTESDKVLKPIIKSIVTKEQFESMEYKIGEV